ncbi:MAG: 3-hydroxyacyl-CoA dehydrogenase NAD-binding domain-containing protein [Candidatus Manganitrophaceae bacterium]
MYIYKAAVIGAGAMGAGIAQVITYSGLPVILKDVNQGAVDRGLSTIRKIYQGRVDKGKMTSSERDQKMMLVTGATDYSGFSDVDLVIEAVFEDLDLKRKLFQELETVCPESTVFASNTSSLPISAIAAVTKKPEKVIGMHFFNPAPVMKLVEVIPGLGTSQETVEDIVSFTESLRKIPIRVQECAGFLVNRLLMPYLNEAALALQEGAGKPKEIDEAIVSFGMPMGPFTLSDMIGIDVAVKVADILYDAYGPRVTPAEIWTALYEAKRYGTKSGAGFYEYGEEKQEGLEAMIAKVQKQTGKKGTGFSVNRLMMPMINEAVISLQEGVATAGDIDIAMMAGTGFPQDKGGPLHYADQVGIDVVLTELQALTKELGPRFWPAPMLKRMVMGGYLGVKSGKGFFNYT